MTVLRLGGVTQAAQRLNLSQSAGSHKLARLEDRIGRPILYKSTAGLAPTHDGRRLLEYAERLIALHDEAVDSFTTSELSGEIRLGSTEDATEGKLAAVLGGFRRFHPQVSLSIKVAQSLKLKFWLQTSEIDMAIMQVFVDEKEAGDIELWREQLIWVQSVDNPFPIGSSVPFVSFDKNCFYRLAASQRLAESGQRLDVVLECPSKEGVRAGVLHGLGIALIGSRNLTPGLVEMTENLPKFPEVCHVLRCHPGIGGEAQKGLASAVIRELVDSNALPKEPGNGYYRSPLSGGL